jgi:hypothetical protein
MAAPQSSSSSQPQLRHPLIESLVALAGTPDDTPSVDALLVMIARLTADTVGPVAYASVTAMRHDRPTTVAASSDLVRAVDEAQYAEQSGPCIETLDTGAAIAVPDMTATIAWPNFRAAAFDMGLRASVSVPLFAGSGAPVASLNLYGHDPATMAPLITGVCAVYDQPSPPVPDGLGTGGHELLAGFNEAFAVRATIQQAIGLLIARGQHTPDDAYRDLCASSAAANVPLGTAAALITRSL